MEIYRHQVVSNIRDYHNSSIREIWKFSNVKRFLESYAQELQTAHLGQQPGFVVEVNNYYKPFVGKEDYEIMNHLFSKDEYLDISASVHGFESFGQVESELKFNSDFEMAVEAMLEGHVSRLLELIGNNKDLTQERSPFGHGATLLHYGASNGVEMWRQIVPHNLNDIVKLLIEHGADLKKTMEVYGGEHTFECLFFTSAHPKEAGVVDKVNLILH